MPRSHAVAVAAAAILAATAAADVTILAPSSSLMEGISSTGTAAGAFNAAQHIMWTPKGGVMPIGGGSPSAGQVKVSEDGMFICSSIFNPATGKEEMGRYDVAAGTWTPLGGLGSSSGDSTSSGWGIAGDGQSVVGLAWISAGTAHAAQWLASTNSVVDLGSTVAGESSRANAADFDGNVVVGWQDGNGRQGAVWVNGVQELITRPDGSPAGEAGAVSANGRWVSGISFSSPFGTAATYLYDTQLDSVQIIPNLSSGGGSRMAGTAVTDDGQTVVGGTWPLGPATFGTAFIWRAGIGTLRLTDYLDELGVAYDPSYTFAFVSDMSDDGRWMVGWGRSVNNQLSTWILEVPGDEPCPSDVDGSGTVDFTDLLSILAAWGPCMGCPEDIDGDGAVAFNDLLQVLSDFGDC
jgi:uncharacterized membrane protein